MENIKIKQYQLFNLTLEGVDILNINPALKALLNFKPEGSALRYDIQTKLTKAVDKAIKEFYEIRTSLIEEHSTKKKVKFKNGEVNETNIVLIDCEPGKECDNYIVEVDGKKIKGKKIIGRNHDLGDNEKTFRKALDGQLNLEIELSCYPIKLSKLDKEKLPDEADFGMLEGFIVDDINKE